MSLDALVIFCGPAYRESRPIIKLDGRMITASSRHMKTMMPTLLNSKRSKSLQRSLANQLGDTSICPAPKHNVPLVSWHWLCKLQVPRDVG